jgi:hypothetical protein
MTDAELLEYLGLPDGPDEQAFVARMPLKLRNFYGRLRETEEDIRLWQQGVAPKPTGVILCHEHRKSKHV